MENLLSNNKPQETLWKLVNSLWENGENKSKYVTDMVNYWEGKLLKTVQADLYFPDQNQTNDNVIKTITETKLKATLDAQFSISVVPDLGAFYDFSDIKNARAVADILNDEMQNILKRNNIDEIKERAGRYGILAGFGAAQTTWETDRRHDGEIRVKFIESNKLRWNKDAKSSDELTFIAYEVEMSAMNAKKLFARNEQGAFDEALCKKIDSIASYDAGDIPERKQSGGVLNYVNNDNSTAGRAYAECTVKGIEGGKSVKLVVMYLMDTSVYAPEEKGDKEVEDAKKEYALAYPNGRLVIFSTNQTKKLILKDEGLPEAFKSLGNIDIFNAVKHKNIAGHAEMLDIVPIQDRINGLYRKYREKVGWDFETLLVDSDFGVEDSSLVRAPVTRVEGLNKYTTPPQVTSNNGIERAKNVLELIDGLKKTAYEIARINETMIYGARQTGTNSGDQVEALQESPLAEIRAIQRNFKDFMVSIGEKIVAFIIDKYTQQRLIELSTPIDKAKYAIMDTDQNGQRTISLLDEAMQAIQTMTLNPEWKYRVDCNAGTEIPRSRREQSALFEKLASTGLLGDLSDIDVREMILLSQDVPNARAIIAMQRKKAQEMSQTPPNPREILDNPVKGKNLADIMKSLQGFTKARAQILQMSGLNAEPDTIEDAPVQETMKQIEPDKILPAMPQLASSNPETAMQQQELSKLNTAKEIAALQKGSQNEQVPVQPEA